MQRWQKLDPPANLRDWINANNPGISEHDPKLAGYVLRIRVYEDDKLVTKIVLVGDINQLGGECDHCRPVPDVLAVLDLRSRIDSMIDNATLAEPVDD